MTPDQIADCRADLLTFSRTLFKARKGSDMKINWHQQVICDGLEKVVLGKTKRLIINVPPRSGKTEFAVINFIAWCMGNFPDSEFIHASYSKRLATNNTFNARAVMQHETYADIFGSAQFRSDSNAKDEFRTDEGGIVYATGADGTITGYGAGKMRDMFGGAIIIDDPHKAGEGSSDTMRKNVINWFSTTMESRKNRPDTPIIVIMQRLHEEDLSGYLLNGGNGEAWDHINIPALMDSGDSFWPEQFPLDDLRRMEQSNAYRFAGQYMQRPSPIGGGNFKEQWWKYYEATPKIRWKAIYADTALKTKEQNDYSVFACWGMTLDGQAILLDLMRGKWEAPELLIVARAFYNKQRSSGIVRAFKVEDKASGTGLIQTLKREGVPVIGIQRSIDKITRAMDATPLIESGNVLLPKNADWLNDFLSEHSAFPNGKHDDMVDTTMDAVCDILSGSIVDYSQLL